MFRKILRFINGGDSRSHSEPVGQLDYWDGRGTIPVLGAMNDGLMNALADVDGGEFNLSDTGSPAAVVSVP